MSPSTCYPKSMYECIMIESSDGKTDRAITDTIAKTSRVQFKIVARNTRT